MRERSWHGCVAETQTSAFQSPDMHSVATIVIGSIQHGSWRFHHSNKEAH